MYSVAGTVDSVLIKGGFPISGVRIREVPLYLYCQLLPEQLGRTTYYHCSAETHFHGEHGWLRLSCGHLASSDHQVIEAVRFGGGLCQDKEQTVTSLSHRENAR